MSRVTFILICAVLPFYTGNGESITGLINFCKANDANLNACVKDMANTLIPHFTKEIDEFGASTLDPFVTSTIELLEETEYISAELKYMDLIQTGLSKMVVEQANIDLGNGLWKFVILQPVFHVIGKYKSTGTIMKIPVDGEGAFNSTHMNTKLEIQIQVSREKRGNDEYFKIEKLNVYYTFSTATMEYQGLFGADTVMEKTTNEFLNENSHEILLELKPELEKVYSDIFRGYVEQLLDKVPASTLFQ